MGLRMPLSYWGHNIVWGSTLLMFVIAPALISITETVLIALKLLGYIKGSWVLVLFGPLLLEITIPVAFCGIGMVLVLLGTSPYEVK
jgi:hypothetical protein